MFFSFDGIDGVGKSTQIELLSKWLVEQGRRVVTCRDPGSTPLGEQVREILLATDSGVAICRRAEMLLYMAARAQLVEEVIRPALERGDVVISDRYLLANIVYQAYAGGLELDAVRTVGAITVDGVMPDAVLLLDMPVAEADKRLNRQKDRMEQQGNDFRERLREGFLAEGARSSAIHVIDADRSIEAIHADVRAIVSTLIHPV